MGRFPPRIGVLIPLPPTLTSYSIAYDESERWNEMRSIGVLVFSANRPSCVVNLNGVQEFVLIDPRTPTYLEAVARIANPPALAIRVGAFAGSGESHACVLPLFSTLALHVHSIAAYTSSPLPLLMPLPPITLRISHLRTLTCCPRPQPTVEHGARAWLDGRGSAHILAVVNLTVSEATFASLRQRHRPR
ncbi:hypothetical protein C8R45DRAFT_1222595 [Mycena sanguinolenta]|nr:hypothetical protein C8R45DRAFT_1222595 [Mycena sanguinolenta]